MNRIHMEEDDGFFMPDDHRPISYEVTEGYHLGDLYRVDRAILETGQVEWRVTWEIVDMTCTAFTYLASTTYRTARQHEILQSMLATWLGPDLPLYRKPSGVIDFDGLIADKHPAMLQIEFYNDGNHTTPFRSVKSVNPVRRQRKAANPAKPVRAIRRRMDDRLDDAA